METIFSLLFWQENRAIKDSSSSVDSETNRRRIARSDGLKILFGTQTGKAKVQICTEFALSVLACEINFEITKDNQLG